MTDETSQPAPHVPTLMTVHAHPDDEVIGTGGTMAQGRDRGPPRGAGHLHPRRDGRHRGPRAGHAREPSPPGRDPRRRAGAGDGRPGRHRVGEPGLPRLGHDGPPREPGPADLLAGEPRRGDRAPGLDGAAIPAGRHDHLQRLRRLRAPGPHPDAPRGRRRVRAGRRPGLVPGAAGARSTAGRARPRARAASRRGRRPSSTSRRSRPRSARRSRSGWRPSASARSGARPRTPRRSSSPSSRPSPPGCSSRTRRSRPGWTCRRSWTSAGRRFRAHVTQISGENPFVRFGRDAWAEFWSREAFVRRETRVPAPDHEDDLFAGLDDAAPGPYGWG